MTSRSELPVLKITSNSRASLPSNGHTVQPALRKQTQISSVYTQLSSVKPTGLPRNPNACKTVRTTHIGNISTNGYTAKAPLFNGNSRASYKSSPELRSSVRTSCVGQSVASPHFLAKPTLTNGHAKH